MQSPYHTIGKAIFYFFGSIFILNSCKTKDDTGVIKAMEESLINSNQIIVFSNQQILMAMRNKTEDPITKERALSWFHVSEQIQTYSTEINDFIEQLKKEKHIKSGQIKNLYKKLKNYKNDVLNVDSSIKKQFEHNITIITKQFDSLNMTEADFTKNFFTNSSANSTKAILTKFQNNIATVENKLLVYCHSITTSHVIIIDDFPTALISQNSKIFKEGDEIKIFAGIGSLKRMQEEEIFVEGVKIPIDETGLAVYKLKASGIGMHYLPVSISYLNADGKKVIQQIRAEYTVAKPCDQ